MLLTTQYLDEAEQLADQIAILHEGRIIVNGTLAELKQLLPPAKVEYVEKQPTLEDVFLAIVGDNESRRPSSRREVATPMDTHFFGDTARATGTVPRTSPAAWTPSSRPRSCRSPSCCCSSMCSAAPSTSGSGSYVNYLLPGILLITIASGISYTAYRLFLDMKSGIFERFQSMPIARSSVLWAHVLTSMVANLVSIVVVVRVALLMGFRSGAGVLAWLAVAGILVPVHPGADVDRRHPGPLREVSRMARARSLTRSSSCRSSARRSCLPTPCLARYAPSPYTSP